MDWFWWLAGVVAVAAWVVALVDMVRRRGAERGQLAAWVLIVIILPVLGTILYFVIGRRRRPGRGSPRLVPTEPF